MAAETSWSQLIEDREVTRFRAELCIDLSESFSLDEKRQICAGMDASALEIEAAIRKEFHSMPGFAQKRMLELLCGADPANYEWRVNLLYHTED